MSVSSIDPLLADVATYLGAAVIAVPLFKRLRLGSIIGFLVAGAVIGPHGAGFIDDAEAVLSLAEIGVVLLLFVIGLELQPSRLWRQRGDMFGLGLAQVVLTGTAITGLLAGTGWLALGPALAVGGALALSSTAFAVQILRERGEITRPFGNRSFSILLFQDLAIVPLLAMVAFLSPAGHSGSSVGLWEVARGSGAVALLVIGGHFGLRPLFNLIARTRSEEVFTAAALLVVLGAALLMKEVGLSMALGAFVAGVLLAESEFRHQLETDVDPFRGLLIGLLFIAVGMSVDWALVWDNLWIVVFGALGLYAGKALIVAVLSRLLGSPWLDAIRIGAVLGQGGEFAFVLFTVSVAGGLVASDFASLLTAIVAVSMALTPLAVLLAGRVHHAMREHEVHAEDVGPDDRPFVIVMGFGRFGQVVARVLRLRGYETVLIDSDPERIRLARTFGDKVFFGDLRRLEMLRLIGVDRARAIFLCADNPRAVLLAAKRLRRRFPNLVIFARAHDRVSELELAGAGVDGVSRELLDSSISLARQALVKFGEGDAVDEIIEEFRRRDGELMHVQTEYGAIEDGQKIRRDFDLSES